MFNKFQALINTILEDVSSAALGTPQQPIYNPPTSISSGDTYAPNDNRNLFGAPPPVKQRKPVNKRNRRRKVKTNKFPVIRRTFPETFLK
jgi:hypothetical protein